MSVTEAIKALKTGQMVLIYDSEEREGETDMAVPAVSTTPKQVARMRMEAGGLICVAISPEAAERLCLPFMSDILKLVSSNGCSIKLDSVCEKPGDLAYDARSSFSIAVNHRAVGTGITDIDRSLTITELGSIVERVMHERVDFGAAFRSPGHVPLLRAARGLISERRGQTELSIALAEMACITPAMTVCEMLDANTGKALTKRDSVDYAKRHNLSFLTGQNIVDAYDQLR
ncbi:MAG TPA: 3,4-dihydroxy-2-butanone-4-phosphate synthase [Candidatus Bathyarchaeia archaeon]|nr:3,4-dihydroxy-2-butanone-4-phosphate synthase [Candidatus Bathyarchaeia archaeon]